MADKLLFTWTNRQADLLAFKLLQFEENFGTGEVQRNNYYSLIWIKEGTGKIVTGITEYNFEAGTLFAFAPFQPFMFSSTGIIRGIFICYDADFLIVHRHDKQIAASSVLYDNIYQQPYIKIDSYQAATLNTLCTQIIVEMANPALAQHEILVAYLKLILINASRIKMDQQQETDNNEKHNREYEIIQKLKESIEKNFRTRHTPGDYAQLLFISPKTLANAVKSHFNKTLSDIVNERIIAEAKSELFLSTKTIKEIAHELGYEDEYYFSRFFKVHTNASPQKYRDTVGFGKGE